MTQKNERLCWNCDGSVSLHAEKCPYCGVDIANPTFQSEEGDPFGAVNHPFQQTPENTFGNPFDQSQESLFAPSPESNGYPPPQEESQEAVQHDEEEAPKGKNEMVALLLLLPGVVFALFGLILVLFADEGKLSLEWNQSFAYFYFFGALPLLFLGWRSLR